MNSILSEIYDALDQSEMLSDLLRVSEEVSRVYDLEDEFEETLPEKMRDPFREIISLRIDAAMQQNKQHFIKGVRLGMQLMLDAMLEREQKQ